MPRFQLSLRARDAVDCRGHLHGVLGKGSLRRANPSAAPAEEGFVGKAGQANTGGNRQPEHSVLWGKAWKSPNSDGAVPWAALSA